MKARHPMRTLLLQVAAALLLVVPLAAQGGHDGESGGHGDPELSTMEMPNGMFFSHQFLHLMPHEKFQLEISPNPEINKWVTFYDVNLYQVIVVIIVLLLFGLVARSFAGSGEAPWIVRVFRGWCHWIRDEIVTPLMGQEASRKWTPLFLYMFFFIVFSNMMGLIPYQVTSTACLFVTGGLATITLAIMLIGGMMQQGVGAFWKNLLPHGLPVALIPLMVLIEVVGLFIKPVALTIRLFANMLAGHLLIFSFVGLIFVFAKMFELSGASWLTAVPAVGMAVFTNIIEALVVLLQAYIFVYLSVLFIQQSLHPDH